MADTDQKIRLSSASIYLPVRRKAGRISGHVQDEVGNPLPSVRISVVGITQSTALDGSFNVVIPGEKLQSDLMLRAVLTGYEPWSDSVVPNSNEIAITLRKK